MEESKIKITSEIGEPENFFFEAEGTVNLLDELLNARDELFDRRLKDGLGNHTRLMKVLKGDSPQKS